MTDEIKQLQAILQMELTRLVLALSQNMHIVEATEYKKLVGKVTQVLGLKISPKSFSEYSEGFNSKDLSDNPIAILEDTWQQVVKDILDAYPKVIDLMFGYEGETPVELLKNISQVINEAITKHRGTRGEVYLDLQSHYGTLVGKTMSLKPESEFHKVFQAALAAASALECVSRIENPI